MRDACRRAGAYGGANGRRKGLVGRSLFGGLVVVSALALPFVAVALSLAFNG